MKYVIDFNKEILKNDSGTIPLFFRQPREISFTISIDAHEMKQLRIPVDKENGEIIITQQYIGNLLFPECFTIANRGQALTEIHNLTNQRITIVLDEPIKVVSLTEEIKNKFELFTCENLLPRNQNKEKTNVEHLIRTDHLNSEEKKAIIALCRKYSDIFHHPEEKLTFTNQVKHLIKTNNDIPVYTKSYRYPFVHKKEVQEQIAKMLENNIIRPSQSPWSSPIWVVPKKQDASNKEKWRIVIDYRKVNEKTIDDRYPIPNINDILDKLGKCQYFTTIDLASGFHQIEMDPKSIEKTAFSVENGHYEFIRMPFGLKNAPATFQRVMDNVLKHLQNKICLVYMDDIIVFSTSLQEHISNLSLLFKTLRENHLKIQMDKSEFLRKEVEFLGHIVTPEGIKPNQKKINAIQNFPIPKTAKDIKSFLGLLGYYRRFIKNFAKITKPFTKCLKKGEKIIHTKEFVETFKLCKDILSNDPILQYPDFNKPFILTTDASNIALGAVLSQGNIGTDLPIAYASRTLNTAECNYSTIEKELLAIVWATKYFRPYLFGRKFTIMTDHKPLQWLFNLKEPNSRLVRWRLKLEEYDYKILYKKGKHNTNADALSRIELNAIDDKDEISSIAVNINDEQLGLIDDLIQLVEEGEKNYTQNNNNHNYFDLTSELEENNQPGTYFQIPRNSPKQTENCENPENKKISVISNEIIKPAEQANIEENESDDETVHTSHENPIIEVPITEKPLNFFKNQVIIHSTRNIVEPIVQTLKIFDKFRITISFPENNIKTHILNFIKTYFQPKQMYVLYFKTRNIEPLFITILQTYFQNSALKLVKTNTILQDLTNTEDQKEKIKYHHEGKTCHKGISEMKNSLSRNYYWPNMIKDITDYVNTCEICQTSKYERNPPIIKFNLTPTSSKPFEHIHMDVFKILNHSFLTIIDSFSRYGQAYSIPTLSSINIIDNLMIFISHHGLPLKITTDNGKEFKNNCLEDFCKLHKIELHFTTAKNSNSNSPVERLHSTLAEQIRCLRVKKPKEPVNDLMRISIIAYNNTIHTSTDYTPFEIINGHINSNDPFDLTDSKIISNYIQNHKENTKILYNKIKIKNQSNKEKLINKLNISRNDPKTYEPGDNAYIATKQRNKANPRFSSSKIINDQNKKLITERGTYHKSTIKMPRQIYNNDINSLQEQQNDDSYYYPNYTHLSSIYNFPNYRNNPNKSPNFAL